MANQRTARLISAQNMGVDARLLEFSLEDELGFTGGQYIIVHTGIPIDENKTAKRAYSILSSDIQQTSFQIAVKRIGTGPGSNFMCDLSVGAELAFSGPWGKFLPRESHPSEKAPDTTIVLATDTGITATMGLVSAERFKPYSEITTVLWLSGPEGYFLPESFVRERVAGLCRNFEMIRIPVDCVERKGWLETHKEIVLQQLVRNKPATAFLSGDGSLLAAFRDALQQVESRTPEILVETFFHHQEMKSTTRISVSQ